VVITDNLDRGIDCPEGVLTIRNSIIFYNNVQIDSQDNNTEVTYSDIEGFPVFEGTGNINDNPVFLENSNYTLSHQSPCIDTGDPNLADSDKYFPPSLGSLRNDIGAYGGPLAFGWYPPLFIKPQHYDFNRVTQDSSESTRINILNYRSTGVAVSDISFENNESDVFSRNLNNFFVDSFDSVDLFIAFKPDSEKTYASDLIFHTQSHGTVSIPFSGKGVLPLLRVVQSEINFGVVPVSEEFALSLPVQNSGGDTLRMNLLPPINDVFQIKETALILNPDFASDIIDITFIPDSVASFLDSLIILSNDRELSRIAIPLSGVGSGPVIDVNPPSLHFGSIAVLSDTAFSVTINNLGNDFLRVDSLVFVQPDTLNETFSIIDLDKKLPISLEPDSSLIVSVRFTPNNWGLQTGGLLVYSSDPLQRTTTIDLSGIGIASVMEVSKPEIAFGEVSILSDSTIKLGVENSGNYLLLIDKFTITPLDSVFELVNDTISFPLEIEPGSGTEFSIEFEPVDTGHVEGQINILTNDPFQSEVTVILSGMGTDTELTPLIDLSSSEINFNEVDTSLFSEKSLFIYNLGQSSLIIPKNSIYITYSAFDAFSIENITTDIDISPLDSQEVIIRFSPLKHGPDEANLWIKSNDPLNPTMIVLLSGTGVGNGSSTISSDPVNSTDPFVNTMPATLSFKINSHIPIDSAAVYVRKGGETEFSSFALHHLGETIIWSTEIDSNFITEQGVEYFVLVKQGQTVSVYPDGGEDNPIAKTVQIPYIEFPALIPAKTYQMISLPFSTSGQDLGDLFIDNLGPYDDSKYRIFECLDGVGYSEIKDMSQPLHPGQSVWLISKDPVELDVHDGESVLTDTEYTIELKQGWSMISTPFAFPVNWLHLNTNLALRYYDGSDWPFAAIMEPYKGYAVNAPSDTVISIPADKAPVSKSLPKSIDSIFKSNWHLKISAESDNVKDQFNYIGAIDAAGSGIDRYAYSEPLPVGDYISLYLVSMSDGKHLSTDFRLPGDDGYIFNIEMKSNLNSKKYIQIEPRNLPEKFDWIVISNKTMVNLEKKPIETSSNNAQYQVAVGTSDFINDIKADYKSVPGNFKLAKNYPNPFNPSTFINFELPFTNEVDLSIYNLLGQKVVTLISERKEAGYHQFEWDASGYASGVYYYRLSTSAGFVQTKKLVLLK
jgi:hypothetical protein